MLLVVGMFVFLAAERRTPPWPPAHDARIPGAGGDGDSPSSPLDANDTLSHGRHHQGSIQRVPRDRGGPPRGRALRAAKFLESCATNERTPGSARSSGRSMAWPIPSSRWNRRSSADRAPAARAAGRERGRPVGLITSENVTRLLESQGSLRRREVPG